MPVNDTYVKSATGVAASGDIIIDGSGSGTGEIDVSEMGGTNGAVIYREVDTAGDGSWSTVVEVDNKTGSWHTQLNNMRCVKNPANGDPVRLRINNDSGSSGDYYVLGVEL
jgi:hypothetical protein